MVTRLSRWRLSEDDLLINVLDLCQLLHLHTAHFRAARTETGWRTPVQGDGKGWPDLVITGQWVMYREVKGATGRMSPEQRLWASWLRDANADVGEWWPDDWRSGRIERELLALAGKKARDGVA